MRGRRRAKQLMPFKCKIERATGSETDRTTGKVTTQTVQVYGGEDGGRCKITSYEGHEQERDVVAFPATMQRLSIHLPIGKYEPHVGDIITITDTDGLDDRFLGMKFRVAQEAPYRTYATADRIFIDSIAK